MAKALKLLIIGGSGFVSGTLAQKAIAQGHEVWILTRGQKAVPKGVKHLVADRHETENFKKVIEEAECKWDAVFDCICYKPEDARQDIEVFRKLTKHLIWISTDFVFDPKKRWFLQTEDNMNFLTDDSYGANKRLCELEFIIGDLDEMVWTALRPPHIYGPGSKLGCLPQNARDPELITKIKEGQTLSLVGGGHFLQQPIFVSDLAELMLSCIGNKNTYNEIFCAMGPDIIESKHYYEIIAEYLDTDVKIEEVPVNKFLAEHPESVSFICHRIYDLKKLKNAGVKVPATSIRDGLYKHVQSLL